MQIVQLVPFIYVVHCLVGEYSGCLNVLGKLVMPMLMMVANWLHKACVY